MDRAAKMDETSWKMGNRFHGRRSFAIRLDFDVGRWDERVVRPLRVVSQGTKHRKTFQYNYFIDFSCSVNSKYFDFPLQKVAKLF